jgi:hypothetical protein
MSFLIARGSSGAWLNPHHRRPLAECLCCRSDHGTATPLDPAHPRGVLARCDHPGASRPEPSPLRDTGGLRAAARRRQGCLEPQPGLRRGVYLQRDARGPRGGRRSRGAAPRGHFAGQVVPEAGGSLPLPRPFPGAWFMAAQRVNRGRRRKRRFCTARKNWKSLAHVCVIRGSSNYLRGGWG